ncbi:hypothetical protein [Kitasatospora sp. SUK 42]|uniref:hypothetical protein n=1 Tax=Kitasatospora sp. SUK 42 TaxID=1588882 RepID=UPI0018CB258F|nr:hypothetical protein [Kitasatospora sp. SUK 42]MBV2155361.1 hypothetical protein [Kitasatospora sp. SUK 42]
MDEGGESACWLERVCPECGRLRERPGPGPCENCGAGGTGGTGEEPTAPDRGDG